MRNLKLIAVLLATIVLYGKAWGENWHEQTITGNVTKTISQQTVSVDGTITIASGATLTINNGTAGHVVIYRSKDKSFTDPLFRVDSGGKLVINGQSSKNIIIDGMAQWTTSDDASSTNGSGGYGYSNGTASDMKTFVRVVGSIDFEYVVLRNNDSNVSGSAIIFTGSTHQAKSTFKNCVIKACRATHGNGTGGGGGSFMYINYDSEGIEMENCEVFGCYDVTKSSKQGGTIRTNGENLAPLTMKNCNIHNNKSQSEGGAINWLGAAKLTLDHCDIHDNIAGYDWEGNVPGGYGGGIYSTGANLVLKNGNKIYHNTANSGGGIYIAQYTATGSLSFDTYSLTVGQSERIYENHAKKNGGGVCMMLMANYAPQTFSFNISIDGTIKDNYADLAGGGIYLGDPTTNSNIVTATLSLGAHSIVQGNYTTGSEHHGGGIYVSETGATVHASSSKTINIQSGCQITGNTATGHGGAFYVNGFNTTITGCNISGNQANRGGAFYCNSSRSNLMTMTGGSITGNTSTLAGGAIYVNTNSTLHISGNSSITGNTSGTNGGGIYEVGTVILGDGNLTVKDNVANGKRSNIFLTKDCTLVVNGTDFNPDYVGIYPDPANTEDYFPVISYQSPASTTTLANIFSGMTSEPVTAKVYDDTETYNAAYNETWNGHVLGDDKIYFIKTPWTPLQRQVYKSDYQFNANNINDVRSLTAYLWKVNGLEAYNGDGDATLVGTITADIDMEEQYWVPIGEDGAEFTGTLNGNGHTISNLHMDALNGNTEFGLFGHIGTGAAIKDVSLANCSFESGTDATSVGSLVAVMEGGDVYNCYSACSLKSTVSDCKIGGLVGTITSGNLINNFSYPKLDVTNNGYAGGLVGSNSGTVKNCYVRGLQTGSSTGSNFGWLVGDNTGGTVQYGYIPAGQLTYVSTGAAPTNSNTFTPAKIFSYDIANDNRVGADRMVAVLNRFVASNSGSKDVALDPWVLPTTTTVNAGLPILKPSGTIAAGSTDGTDLNYASDEDGLVSMLNSYGTGAGISLYANADLNGKTVSQGAATFAIHPSASLLQRGNTIRALVNIAMQYTEGTQYYHGISSSISNWPMGFSYGDDNEVEMSYLPNPCLVSVGSNGIFPSDITTSPDVNTGMPWDFYDYSEPWTHWVNYRRNSLSHWHEVYTTQNLNYTNHTSLQAGKGYLAAVNLPYNNDSILLQHEGTLNSGNVGVGVTKSSTEYTVFPGINMIGNPYESYIDFNQFATANNTLWSGTPFYAAYDKDNGFVYYTQSASENYPNTASRYIHKHQGFLVEISSSGSMSFTEAMRTNTGSAHFRDWDRNYPLVNLIVTDSEGKRDVCVVEMNRPDEGGAEKLIGMNMSSGDIYARQNDANYSIVFTDGRSNTPIWFEAREEATYTLTWSTRHGEFGYLHLIDNLTGADIDLTTAQEYAFTGKPSDFKSRFKLVCQCTGVEENEVHSDAPFAFMSNGQLVVTGEGILQLIDLNGRVLKQAQVNGMQSAVSLPELATGVYILKLNDRTQKIVM